MLEQDFGGLSKLCSDNEMVYSKGRKAEQASPPFAVIAAWGCVSSMCYVTSGLGWQLSLQCCAGTLQTQLRELLSSRCVRMRVVTLPLTSGDKENFG